MHELWLQPLTPGTEEGPHDAKQLAVLVPYHRGYCLFWAYNQWEDVAFLHIRLISKPPSLSRFYRYKNWGWENLRNQFQAIHQVEKGQNLSQTVDSIAMLLTHRHYSYLKSKLHTWNVVPYLIRAGRTLSAMSIPCPACETGIMPLLATPCVT